MFKIYVGNLDYKVKLEQLRELFAVYAPIEDLVIPTDPKTNRAKGFAIVMIRDSELGEAAVKAMQGKRLMGRTLVVNQAVKRKKGEAAPQKSEVLRNGPFGPRMNRFGDPRAGGGPRPSRNPRRMGGTGRPNGGSSDGGVRPAGPAAGEPQPVAPSTPAAGRGNSPPGPNRPQALPQQRPTGPGAASSAAPPAVPQTGQGGARSEPARPLESPSHGNRQATTSASRANPAPRAATTGSEAAPPARPKAQRLASPKRPTEHGGESEPK